MEIILVDVSQPDRPFRKGSYRFPELQVFPWQAAALGQYLYVLDQRCAQCGVYSDAPRIVPRLLTFDVADPTQPKLTHQFSEDRRSHMTSLTREGPYLYVNEFNYGLRIFSIARPECPELMGGDTHRFRGKLRVAQR